MYNIDHLRATEFPYSKQLTYLNHAGISPLPARSQAKVAWAVEQLGHDPSHFWSEYCIPAKMQLSERLAEFVNAWSANEITLVTTTSAALNAVAQALPLKRGDNIVFCDIEFPANAYPWMSLERDGIEIRCLPARNGELHVESVAGAVDAHTRVVAASAVQFFSGHRTDLATIGRFCHEHDILFVVDAIQAIGHIPIDMQAMKIDVLATGGQKSLLALPGTGFMAIREAVAESMSPRTIGANSTREFLHWLAYDLTPLPGAARFSMGTENLPGMWSIAASLELLEELGVSDIDAHTTALSRQAIDALESAGFKVITPRDELGPIVTFRSGYDVETTVAIQNWLAQRGIVLAHHLDAPGNAYLRASFHAYSVAEDIERLINALKTWQQKSPLAGR